MDQLEHVPPSGSGATEEIHFRQIKVVPAGDGSRVRVYLEVDPFRRRPSIELRLLNPDGKLVASAEIVEAISPRMELNLHIRQAGSHGQYVLEAVLYFFDLSEAEPLGDETIERKIMDMASQIVSIEA